MRGVPLRATHAAYLTYILKPNQAIYPREMCQDGHARFTIYTAHECCSDINEGGETRHEIAPKGQVRGTYLRGQSSEESPLSPICGYSGTDPYKGTPYHLSDRDTAFCRPFLLDAHAYLRHAPYSRSLFHGFDPSQQPWKRTLPRLRSPVLYGR